MKTPTARLAVAATLTLGSLLAGALASGAAEMGPYFTGSLGGTVADDVTVREFPGFPGGTKLTLDPGVHFGFAGGFNVNEFLGFELESGVLENTVDRLGGTSPDAAITHVPFLANIVLRCDVERLLIVPYITAGVGGDSTWFSVNNSLGLDGSDADFVFAYQFSAGLLYKINDKMSAGVGYKYYHTDPSSYDVNGAFSNIRFGETRTHSISAVFNMKF